MSRKQCLKNLLYKEDSLSSYISSNLHKENYGDFLYIILLRFYLDGEISRYPQINNKSHIFSSKNHCVIVNFHLTKSEIEMMNKKSMQIYLVECIKYSIKSADQIMKKRNKVFNAAKLNKDLMHLLQEKGIM